MTSQEPLLVLRGCPAHLGFDLTRTADLYVYLGELGVRLRRFALSQVGDGSVVRQSSGPVRVNIARLPPWYDTIVFIGDATHECMVGLPRWRRRRLVQALNEAGLPIEFKRRSLLTLYAR